MAEDVRSIYRVYWPPAPGPYGCSLDFYRGPLPSWAVKFYDSEARETFKHVCQAHPSDLTADMLSTWVASLTEPNVAREIVAKMLAKHPELFVPTSSSS